MGHPLNDSVIRFERAKRHLNRLDSEVTDAFFRGDFRGIDSQTDRDGEVFTFRWIVSEVKPPDVWWPVLVGEILYNLRAALDYMAVGHGGKGFPIHADPKKWTEASSRTGVPFARSGFKLTEGMARPVAAAIEACQPYRMTPAQPRSDPLWLLDQLRNKDTHGQLHVVSTVATEGGYEVTQGELTEIRSVTKFGPLKEGAEVMRVTGRIVRPAPPNVTVRFRTTLSIAFEKGGPGGEQIVGVLLNDILNRVSLVAERVRTASR